MGSILTRENGRCVIQWIDGSGRLRQETVRSVGANGQPLTQKGVRQEARRRLVEYEAKALRERHGLDPLPSDSLEMPFGELLDWWWEQKGKTLRSTMVRPFLEKHLRPTIGPLRLRELTTSRLQRLFADKVGELSPKSLNHLRGFLFNIFEVAKKAGGPWAGRLNPVADVERFKVVPKPKKILAPEEWAPVLAEVPVPWRGPVAMGLYAVLREGEIFGMRKEDVDLDAGVLMVCRSWEAPRTKDGKALPVPVADALRPYLEHALRATPGELLFPQPDGSMHSRKLRLNRMLRAAIARAGLLEGYEHRCRAAHCGWRQRRSDADLADRCPRCGKNALWARPIPRHVRFHDTRHSGGTAMVKGAGMAVAQKFLRHSDVRLTIHTYGHLDVEDVRAGMAKAFAAAGPKAEIPPKPAIRPKCGTAELLQDPPSITDGASGDARTTAKPTSQASGVAGDSESESTRTDARTTRCAASARTRCSWAA